MANCLRIDLERWIINIKLDKMFNIIDKLIYDNNIKKISLLIFFINRLKRLFRLYTKNIAKQMIKFMRNELKGFVRNITK